MTVDDVQSWQEVEASSALMLHPVLDGTRFAKKVHVHGKLAVRDGAQSEIEWMRQQLGRVMSDEDRTALAHEIEQVENAPPSARPVPRPGRERRQRA